MTHDYKCNGTRTLFAALNVLDGKVIGHCMPRHRHRSFSAFMRSVVEQTRVDLNLHVILGNYAAHKHPAVPTRPPGGGRLAQPQLTGWGRRPSR